MPQHRLGYPTTRWRARRVPLPPLGSDEQGRYGILVSALRKGGCALMKKTLDQPGCHVMASNKAGHTLLHCACRLGDEEAVQLLLERGADQASCDECGKTPLHDACWAVDFNPGILKAVLDRDPNLMFAIDRFRATALEYCHNSLTREFILFIMRHQTTYWPPLGESTSSGSSSGSGDESNATHGVSRATAGGAGAGARPPAAPPPKW